MAWLNDQWNHETKESHMDARLDRTVEGPLSHRKRKDGRDQAKGMAAMRRVLEWEGAPPDFEEPVVLGK